MINEDDIMAFSLYHAKEEVLKTINSIANELDDMRLEITLEDEEELLLIAAINKLELLYNKLTKKS